MFVDLSGRPKRKNPAAKSARRSSVGKQGQGENFNLVIQEVAHKSTVTVFLLRRRRKTTGGAVTRAAKREKRNESRGEKTVKREESSEGKVCFNETRSRKNTIRSVCF